MNLKEYIRKTLIESLLLEKTFEVFHGTNNTFDTFSYDKIGSNTQSAWNGYGFYFTDNKSEASHYGKNIMRFRIRLDNPIDITHIKDTSVPGSGLVKLFAHLKGFEDLKIDGYTYKELSQILNKMEQEYDANKISFSEGSNKHLQHVWYEYENQEYVLRDKTQHEIDNKEYIKSLFLGQILTDKYNIDTMPVRIKDIMNPASFTMIAKRSGYDGVIAPNSTAFEGNEYVVFDKDNIQQLNNINEDWLDIPHSKFGIRQIDENLNIDITKKTEPAPYFGSRFGQDVEPKGTYVTQGKIKAKGYVNGIARLKKPLFINVTDNTLIQYKRDLAIKFKAKGQKLTNKLMELGYDSIITVNEDGKYGEIVLFPNSSFMMD